MTTGTEFLTNVVALAFEQLDVASSDGKGRRVLATFVRMGFDAFKQLNSDHVVDRGKVLTRQDLVEKYDQVRSRWPPRQPRKVVVRP